MLSKWISSSGLFIMSGIWQRTQWQSMLNFGLCDPVDNNINCRHTCVTSQFLFACYLSVLQIMQLKLLWVSVKVTCLTQDMEIQLWVFFCPSRSTSLILSTGTNSSCSSQMIVYVFFETCFLMWSLKRLNSSYISILIENIRVSKELIIHFKHRESRVNTSFLCNLEICNDAVAAIKRQYMKD